MNWDKIKSNHYFKTPIEHFYASTLYDIKEYDKLYENQNNLSHQSWKDFAQRYNIGFNFLEDFKNIDLSKEVICLWFFKERSNSTASYVQLKCKKLPYFQNTFLITKSKDISFIETKRKYIRNPLIQLEISMRVWNNLIERFDKGL